VSCCSDRVLGYFRRNDQCTEGECEKMEMHHIAEIEDREQSRWWYCDSLYTCPFPFNSTDAYMQTKRVVNLASAQPVIR
jgi:hypothetical protein